MDKKTPGDVLEEVLGVLGGLGVAVWFTITQLDLEKIADLLQ